MMTIIRSILLSKNPSACFHMLGKNVLKDWNATFASYCCCFPQTTQEKPLLKLKISKSHLLCCGKLGGLHCLLLLTDILFRSVSAPLWSFVTRFNKFSHWEMATKTEWNIENLTTEEKRRMGQIERLRTDCNGEPWKWLRYSPADLKVT